MTQSLKGRTFFQWQNSFVLALVSEQVLADIERRQELINFANAQNGGFGAETELEQDLAHFQTVPIFTFAKYDRVKELPLLTGSVTMLYRLQQLIQDNGGGVCAGHPFHVPFSNGPNNYDYRYATTSRQFEKAFGITRAKLMLGVNERHEAA